MCKQPVAYQHKKPIATTVRFLTRMASTLCFRTLPASSKLKPACMKNTSKPAKSIQMVSKDSS